jgi:hypothetical protein
MNNKTLLIILGIAVVLLVLTLVFSGGNFSMGEGEDPAMMMTQRSQARQSAARPPAEPAAEQATPAMAEPEPVAGGNGEAPAAEAPEGPDAEADEAPAEEATEPAEDTVAADDSDMDEDEAAPEEPAEAEAADEEPAAEADAGEEEAAEEEAAAEDDLLVEEELPEDPIERFKQMDPREIIRAKYRDLEERQTEPWNEDDPDQFIPQTGRVDPLTRVSSAVPDDLKPPRSGETDENQIETYLGTQAATAAVTAVSYSLICHNVIQIGLEKRATFSFPPVLGDRTFTIPEGQGFGINVGGVNVTVQVIEITTDDVDVRIVGAVPGSSAEVTKNQKYIPRAFYH